ncbi:MAG: GAF domain-containing protein [Cytophagia bacterium]|nr:MAG: GAF domain-containing protein [Cytophagia bacterium]TAG43291.1 MAG: GAF domain-containing protein [Cytophagia bacterium]
MTQNRLHFLLTFLFVCLAILLLLGVIIHWFKVNEVIREYLYLIWLILSMSVLVYASVVIVRYILSPYQIFKERLEQLAKNEDLRTYSARKSSIFSSSHQSINAIENNIKVLNQYIKKSIELEEKNEKKPLYMSDDTFETFKNLENTIQENQDEAKWMRVLTEFSHLLRNNTNQTLEKTLKNFLNYLIKFFEAQQGAIYIYDDNNTDDLHLKLLVSYAYSEDRYKKNRFELNEGLIGECWQHNKLIKIENVPATYTKISSGLGGSTAKILLLVPVVFRNEVLGVIEILSFENYNDYKIDLIENIARNLGIALENERKINQKK